MFALFAGLAVAAFPFRGTASSITSSTPQLQGVYGGSILALSAFPKPDEAGVTRLLVSTYSANSAFYTDIRHAASGRTNIFPAFRVVPDLDANANRGILNAIAAHKPSGRLFAANNRGLFSCTDTAGSLTTNIAAGVSAVLIESNSLVAVGGTVPGQHFLAYGSLDVSGRFIAHPDSPNPFPDVNFPTIAVHPISGRVYILDRDNGTLYKTTTPYDQISGATTTTVIALPTAHTNWSGRFLGIGPDGRLFIGSDEAGAIVIAYTDDDGGSWTVVNTGFMGGTGNQFGFSGSTSAYHVAFSSILSTNKGEAGTWARMPRGGEQDTNPGSGPVAFDPLNPDWLYFRTDQGIGASTNLGVDTFDICNGMAAVQVFDIDMTADLRTAWIATMSGVFRATNFNDRPAWSSAMMPFGNGAPYKAVAVDRADPTGHRAYAGNSWLYKTADGGATWEALRAACTNFPNQVGVTALEANSNIVAAGTYEYFSASPNGQVLVSTDAGSNWTEVALGMGANVYDLLLVNGAETGLYVAVEFNPATGTGGVFFVNNALVATPTLVGPMHARSLAMDSQGGIYASCKMTNHDLAIFYKASATSSWETVPTNGLVVSDDNVLIENVFGAIMAVGRDSQTNDVPIAAIQRQVYYLPRGASAWTTSADLLYPAGTEINTLFWDELMLGTGIGLYGQLPALDPTRRRALNDYNGDAISDLTVFDTRTGAWYARQAGGPVVLWNQAWGWSGAAPVPGDYDGDGLADLAVFDMQNGFWYLRTAAGVLIAWADAWGWPGAIPVFGDYDGDAISDLAVFDSNSGAWYVRTVAGALVAWAEPWGWPGAIPVPGDYNGDGASDLAVFDSNSGRWYARSLGGPALIWNEPWGWPGAVPVSGDYDGDAISDLAVFDSNSGAWYIRSAAGTLILWNQAWGWPGAWPVPGDFDGDGAGDLAVFDSNSGAWCVRTVAGTLVAWAEPWGWAGAWPVGRPW
jgi:hypothetical protein